MNKKYKKKKMKNGRRAATVFFLIFIFLFGIVLFEVARLKITHTKDGYNLEEVANAQYAEQESIEASRGTIYDRNEETLAVDIEVYDMYAILDDSYTCFKEDVQAFTACNVKDPDATATQIIEVLGLQDNQEATDYFNEQLNKDTYQVEFGQYGKNLSLTQKESIEALNLDGVYFNSKNMRFYPYGDFASYVLGYAQANDEGVITGQMGIESALDGYLQGKDGYENSLTDSNGIKLTNSQEQLIAPRDGVSVYLTLDEKIQSIVQTEVDKELGQIDGLEYDLAFTIVMDAKKGDILAAYKTPSFDPNVREISDYQNPFTDYCFEPGSTMKTMSVATAYDSGNWNDERLVPTGKVTNEDWGDAVISDWNYGNGWGKLNWKQGYYMSSNTVLVDIQQTIGNETWDEYMKNKFLFGVPVQTEFMQTSACQFDPTYPLEYATSSFGQGVTVNSLQMLRAYSAITNSGVMVTPHIVDQIKDSDTGEVLYTDDNLPTYPTLSEETANFMLEQLYNVINYDNGSITGSANKYKGTSYSLGTKTGTAEYVTDGSYSSNSYIYSTMNVAPVEDPQVILYTVIVNPSDLASKDVAMPNYVKSIIDQILAYENSENTIESENIESYNVPNYINKDISSIEDSNVVKFGTGQVSRQFPTAGQTTTAKTYVFGDISIEEINFVGMQVDEANAVCQAYDITCTFSGVGTTIGDVKVDENKKYILTLK